MPKKKPPRNAFFYFMLDYKERCERNGERFPNGLRDVQIEAGPEWDVLPASERKKYEDMAKEEKAKLKGDMSQKFTNMHKPFKQVDQEELEAEENKNRMNNYIENKIQSLSTKKLLAEHKFYLIHVNYFCISEGECYHPAELAISEFCLGDGVTDVYHCIINPGDIPLGYRHDAMQKSETTHRIPVDSNEGVKDFALIMREIKQFLEPGRRQDGGDYPPMYTMPDNINLNTSISAVKSVINTLCNSTVDDDSFNFPIYSLEKLFYELQRVCSCVADSGDGDYDEDFAIKTFTTISLAQIELEKDVFNYTPHIACEFHNKEDVVEFCSKSYVQRWVFLICDHCCQFLNIEIIAGAHLPVNADVNFKKKRQEEKKVEALEKAAAAKPISWIDHAKTQTRPTPSGWVPRQQPPVNLPTRQANLAALGLVQEPERIDTSEENFPAMPVRGRGFSRGGSSGSGGSRGRGYALSFADAMRNKK